MLGQNTSAFLKNSNCCVRCEMLVTLEARLGELEERLNKMETKLSVSCSEAVQPSASRTFSEVLASSPKTNSNCTETAESVPSSSVSHETLMQDEDGFTVVHNKKRAKRMAKLNQAQPHNNKTASPGNRPAKNKSKNKNKNKDDIVIGTSVVRDVKLPDVSVTCIPGAGMGNIEGRLRLLKQGGKKFRRVVIHAGGNDVRRKQSEVLKVQVAAVCDLAKSMSDTVVFSGPLPNLVDDEMYSRHLSFNRWLSSWSKDNDVAFIDNWSSFWGKSGLMCKDGVHPTVKGTNLLTKNMADCLNQPN